MRIKANNIKEKPLTGAEIESAVDEKLTEVAALLAGNELDDDTRDRLQQKFNNALYNRDENVAMDAIAAFNVIDKKEDASREELLDEFSILLLSNKVDSRVAGKYLKAKKINNLVLIIISVVMVMLGLSMIIIPAPPSFELFTIYYFTEDDGITIMDVIACIIILTGIYMLIRTLYEDPFLSRTNE
ncbi:hypothetical protein ACFQZS_04700 [Mucilaginibacter calamicampi]|uniref:Uncharacterized protein n=1 Tax=Mucilaginibacter calamicampi TaxID=1302352 RepID=A0ABW2YSN1_9SPHI